MMSTRKHIYRAFRVNNDQAAFDACDRFLTMKAEGNLVAAIQSDNTLRLTFTPFSWSRYAFAEVTAPNRFEAIFTLVSTLIKQRNAHS